MGNEHATPTQQPDLPEKSDAENKVLDKTEHSVKACTCDDAPLGPEERLPPRIIQDMLSWRRFLKHSLEYSERYLRKAGYKMN